MGEKWGRENAELNELIIDVLTVTQKMRIVLRSYSAS